MSCYLHSYERIFQKYNLFIRFFIFTCAFSFIVLPISGAKADGPSLYLQQLIRQAREKKLSGRKRWHLLLHYQKGLIGDGATSFAIGKDFFNAIDGRTNPQGELEATLASFFSGKNLKASQQTSQCTYPARYRWLKSQLQFDPVKLPEQKCALLEEYLAKMKAERISLVVAGTSMHDPASIWGHLFFKLAPRKVDDWKKGYTFAYGADIPDSQNDVLNYVFRGVFGGYPGTMRIVPYQEQVAVYNEVENRDMWEYDLNFNQEQIDYMALHVWELGSTYFPYYFFKENCAYFLLTLLEVANPNLDLTSRIFLRTVPSDLIRILKTYPGFIKQVHYRPSRMTQLAHYVELLNEEEQVIVLNPIDNFDYFESDAFQHADISRRYLILQGAITYTKYKLVSAPSDTWLDTLDWLQKKEAEINYEGDMFSLDYRPGLEEGHLLSWVNLNAGGSNSGESFAEIGLSSHYHDLLSPETGYAPNSTINLLTFLLRYEDDKDAEEQKTNLEYFDIVSVVSLSPINPYHKTLSWRARVGWEKLKDLESDHLPFVLNFGIGFAVKDAFSFDETLYFFAEPLLQIGGMFDNDCRVGLSWPVGVVFDIASFWSVSVGAKPTTYFQEEYPDFQQYSVEQRFALTKNSELRVSWKSVEEYSEASISFGQHF